MGRMKQYLNSFVILMVTMILCTGCKKKSFVDSIVEMYDNGIEIVDKAKSVDDVQKCYNDINKKVEEFKQNHLREMASTDSIEIKIEKAKNIFTKACCVKAFSYEGYIKDTRGIEIGVDNTGAVLPTECIAGDDGLASDDYEDGNSGDLSNPLGLTGITPIFQKRDDFWNRRGITVQNLQGDYIYNDEDAERYYIQYLPLFFMAYKIVPYSSDDEELVNYLTNNLSNIVSNLPLDDSYPQNIREYVNKLYYDNKDAMTTLRISERGYGYIKCSYYDDWWKKYYSFTIYRDKNNNGRLVIN